MNVLDKLHLHRHPWGLDSDPAEDWRRDAACAHAVHAGTAVPEDWDLLGDRTLTQDNVAAKAICRRCPVKAACLADAADTHANGVIRAELTWPRQRKRRGKQAVHGPASECAVCGYQPLKSGCRYCGQFCARVGGNARRTARRQAARETVNA